jgi:beta-lactamase class A
MLANVFKKVGRVILNAPSGSSLALLLSTLTAFAQPVQNPATFTTSPKLQALVDSAAQSTLEQFREKKLQASQLAITLIDLRSGPPYARASVRGSEGIYPASVVKLFYLAAAHRWMEDGKLADTAELRRAMNDMIVDSSNDATSYIVDLLTGTTSGPELPDADLKTWFDQRNAVNRYFAGLGYLGINVNKKPWGDGPYGREKQASAVFEQKRNMLTTDAVARLLSEIATGRCITPARSAEMMKLLSRDPATNSADPDNQAKFTGPALPAGAKLWSKAGWTSQTRHDAACIELPNGAKFVLVTFTTEHAKDTDIISTVAKAIVGGMSGVSP